jgi:chemotaxis protein histidine kinase CheA
VKQRDDEPDGDHDCATTSAEQFERYRAAFHDRLRGDRVRLTLLTAMLARAEQDPRCAVEEIRVFAHRLRGGAALFGAREVAIAASALERAANRALSAHGQHIDAAVRTALETLCEQLSAMVSRIGTAAAG